MENDLWKIALVLAGRNLFSIFPIVHFPFLIFHLGVDQAFSSYLFPVLL
jgi:hypothetical protein